MATDGDDSRDAFCRNVVIVDESGNVVDAQDTGTFNDVPEYRVIDQGVVNPKIGHQFFYGGEGGHSGD
ncbi:hypothetical protein HS088_TW20G00345 [Tripterygium wilfordii]|uniref:Uncharacterized protein n=1 Tax=Tripterygium wilfordii TaxID=458696 RepID=A0A7J7C7P8_TRIWF|nr:hypothetical protein HS088_TW20G00345 [Tripterygium wilfordii]